MSRLTRTKIIGRMWECGMPSTDPKFADVFFAARKAGLDDAQAFALASSAYYAAKGYEWQLTKASNWLRCSTLERKANDSPRSLFAYLRHKLGVAYRYATDAEISDTSLNDHAGWSAWSDAQPQAVQS